MKTLAFSTTAAPRCDAFTIQSSYPPKRLDRRSPTVGARFAAVLYDTVLPCGPSFSLGPTVEWLDVEARTFLSIRARVVRKAVNTRSTWACMS